MLLVDAMNVRGAVPDGWWRDPDAALCRLVDAIAAHRWNAWVVVVADGRPVAGLPAGTRGDVELRYAGHNAPDAADDLIVLARDELGLPVEGLMCIPPLEEEPALHFALLREIARRNGLAKLSMGMSGDFETAIGFGATHVRVGTAIFGPRPPR